MANQHSVSDDPTPKMPEQPAIDLETFEQLRLMLGRDNPQMLAGLIENYLENTPELLTNLRQAIVTGDKTQPPQIVQTLKSTSIVFGAVRLGALGAELETNSVTDALAKLLEIEAEYERVKLVLEAEWQRLYELRLKTDVFFPTGSYKNIGFYPHKSIKK